MIIDFFNINFTKQFLEKNALIYRKNYNTNENIKITRNSYALYEQDGNMQNRFNNLK